MKKIDKYYIYILFIALFFVFIVTPSSFLFGSTIDWVSQHIAFPDYFRKLFYETGNLFPNFAFSIGGGQNIFHFSYYGLFNPFVILSYFFPFLDMTFYLIGMNIVLYICSALLLYKWLKRHFEQSISFLGSILLLCATPILFHFHRHFMFVSYMPFLILGLMGVEDYFEKNKRFLLIFSTFFIILMSYFYSIPSILVFVLYGVFFYLKREEKITFKKFVKDGICFVFPILIGIFLTAFFLLPTFYTVLSGRGGKASISLLSLIFPYANVDGFVYDAYGMGLTSIVIFALLYGVLDKEKEYKFLSISILILLCFPIFSYFLNGTLYIRNKVFIPFIPLVLFQTCVFIKDMFEKPLFKKFYFLVLIVHIFFLVFGFHKVWYYIEAFLTLLFIYFIHKNKAKKMVFLFLCAPVVSMLIANRLDTLVDRKEYKKSIGVSTALLEKLEDEDDLVRTYHLKNSLYNVNKVYGDFYHVDSLYSSIYNEEYRNFYKDIFKNPITYRNRLVTSQNNNLLYQIFMGGKYLYSDKGMIGYKSISDDLYQNDDVFPLFYVNDHLLNEKEFDKLSYPYTVFSLMENTVVSSESFLPLSSIQVEDVPNYSIQGKQNLRIQKRKNGYKVKAFENNKLTLSFDETLSNKVVLLDFELGREWNCKDGDSFIVINDRKNKLTCNGAIYKNENRVFHYVLSDSTLKDLTITFEKGSYFLSNFHMYVLDYSSISNLSKNFVKMKVDKKKSKGDIIEGNIKVKKDGYFVTSIPYDKGFTIYDNGKKISYEEVNKAFLGFPIKKGTHFIRMEYHSPYFFLGKCISSFTLFALCIYYSIVFRNNRKKKKYNKMTMKKVKKI